MKKKEFLDKLQSELSSLPKEDVKDILHDYESHFAEGKKNKRSESAIANSLGDPAKLAKQHMAEFHIDEAKKNRTFSTLFRAVVATAGLTLFNLIIVLGPFIALMGILFASYITVGALAISSLAICVVGIISLIKAPLFGLGLFFGGIAIGSLTVLLTLALLWVTKWVINLTLAYLRSNIKIIVGEKK